MDKAQMGQPRGIARLVRAAFGAAVALVPISALGAVQISSAPTQNMNCSSGVCSPTAQNAVLNVTDLATLLAGGDTTITSGALAQDIEINAALSWTSAWRLTLDSYRSISFEKSVVVAGEGSFTITTNDGGAGGDFRFFEKGHVELWDQQHSSLTINGHGYSLVKNMKELKSAARNAGFYIALVKNINLSRHHYHAAPIPSLDGTFEGLGNEVIGLTITDPTDRDDVSFIGELNTTSGHGVIRDIGLVAANIQGTGMGQGVGALLGENMFGTVQNSYATGTVSGSDSSVGGLVGDSTDGMVVRSYSTATVSGGGGSDAGGLVGSMTGECFATCSGEIDQSYATGSVTGDVSADVGGLVGENAGATISNSYAKGAATVGGNGAVGGLVGVQELNSPGGGGITSSYSVGLVSGGSGASVGGVIGQDLAQIGISDVYWDLDTSGISDPTKGAGNVANDPGLTGLSDTQLKSGLPTGFGRTIWKHKAATNGGYPFLIGVPPS